MKFYRLTIALILPLLALLAGLLALPGLARAQGGGDGLVWHGWTIPRSSTSLNVWPHTYAFRPCDWPGPDPYFGEVSNDRAYVVYFMSTWPAYATNCDVWKTGLQIISPVFSATAASQISFTIEGGGDGSPGQDAQWHFNVRDANGNWSGSYGNYGNGTYTFNIPAGSTQALISYLFPWGQIGPRPYLTDIQMINLDVDDPPTQGGDLCPLVVDSHFESPDPPLWSLYGTAAITDSNVILSPGDFVAQNLTDTLESGLAYSVVVSVSQVTAPGPLAVSLGSISATLDIAEAGRYTTTLTAPAASGPVLYALENTGYGDLYIDYTCLSTADGEKVCLAPDNGTFDTAQGWLWYRNAFWEQAGQMAALPYNQGSDGDMALVQAGRAYSMPVITTGQYLILGYQAQAGDEVGLISSKVGSAENEQKIYQAPYDYEVDISTQAGQSVDLAFADSGTSDLLLDNVCVFISPNPPQLPQPTDPGGIKGIDFGFNYTCRDVPALLAGWGINVYGAQAVFDAGVSIWEPQYYIPWLGAALWSNAGRPISCFIVEHMRLLAGVTQQQINEFLNFVNWSVRSANAGAPWLQSGFSYLNKTIFSPAVAARATAVGWLPWWSNNTRSLLQSVGDNWKITLDWLKEAALYVGRSAGGSSQDLADNLPGGITGFGLPGIGTGWGLLNLIWSFVDLVWWLWNWILSNIILLADVPIRFYYAFNDGVSGQAFGSLMSCANQNFWCGLLAGTQLVNQTIGHTILYPIVIVGIILTTFAILWKHFWSMVSIEIR